MTFYHAFCVNDARDDVVHAAAAAAGEAAVPDTTTGSSTSPVREEDPDEEDAVSNVTALLPRWRITPHAFKEAGEPQQKTHGHNVFTSPRLVSRAMCQKVVDAVAAQVAAGNWTDRGAGLLTRDVYLDLLESGLRAFLKKALDAGCQFVETATGDTVQCNESEPPFIITYDAAVQQGLARHKDGTDSYTMLISLDEPRADFDGGGTRFYPKKKPFGPFTVVPDKGCAVIFPQNLEHQGVSVVKGKRRLLAAFLRGTHDMSDDARQSLRARQAEAFAYVRGSSRNNPAC